jgi:hypothetical protein
MDSHFMLRGLAVEDINQGIPGTKSDIDIVSDGTLWQVKVGGTSLGNAQKLLNWVNKAIGVLGSRTKIGLKLDSAANEQFQGAAFQKVWNELRAKYPNIEFRDVEVIATPPVP